MEIKCLIIDDEYPARVLLSDYISKIPQLTLNGTCKNPMDAINILNEQGIDLIFLDIQMPQLTGIELLKSLQHKPLVIFTTAYPDYALEGYELNVTDYLLKPIAFDRFVQAVNKVISIVGEKSVYSQLKEEKNYITVKADHKLYRLQLKDILYIEGLREYVTFFTAQGKIITLESLKNLEAMLPSGTFIRVHKSFIVNKEKVKVLYGNQLEIEGRQIPIGKLYKDDVIKMIFEG
jgi:two-component system, LytTR family, response regulator